MNADTNRPKMSAPTPETDASRGYALSSHYGRLKGSYLQMDRSGPFVHAEVARKLERERDEAWEEIKNLQGAYDDATNYYARIIELIDERDEAREKYTALATENMLAVNKLAEERDEALAQVKELIYISDRAIALAEIDFENDKFGIVFELRDGLEKIKEGAK